MSQMTSFAERFAEASGMKMTLRERALAGKLGPILCLDKISTLITEVGSRQSCDELVYPGLVFALATGNLRATLSPGHQGDTIHRDDARRYFQSIGLMPDEGTALWCWLRGRAAEQAKTLRADQQDKADFQQMCIEHWAVSPLTRIRGNSGIIAQLGSAYANVYTEETVERWASEVAPPEVKARKGRPKKPPPV